jgi:hypothetical protein
MTTSPWHPTPGTKGGTTLDERTRATAHRLVDEFGERAAAKALGVERSALLRALAGRPIRGATLEKIRHHLAALLGSTPTQPQETTK